eukprot:10274096-Heterocapsa_arctica.AAC.1
MEKKDLPPGALSLLSGSHSTDYSPQSGKITDILKQTVEDEMTKGLRGHGHGERPDQELRGADGCEEKGGRNLARPD